jgi:hypothetical protein
VQKRAGWSCWNSVDNHLVYLLRKKRIAVAIEKWIAAASLGMFVMFVAETASLSIFLTPRPSYEIDPSSQMREFISISGAPALILAGFSFLLARRYGSRLCGSLIIGGGTVTIVGMYYVNAMLVPKISLAYLVPELSITPTLFMAVSIPVMIVGSLLFRVKPKPKRDYFFDR